MFLPVRKLVPHYSSGILKLGLHKRATCQIGGGGCREDIQLTLVVFFSEHLAPLALFDDRTSQETKAATLTNIS